MRLYHKYSSQSSPSKKNDMQHMPHCNTCQTLPKSKVIFQKYTSSFEPFNKPVKYRGLTLFFSFCGWENWHKLKELVWQVSQLVFVIFRKWNPKVLVLSASVQWPYEEAQTFQTDRSYGALFHFLCPELVFLSDKTFWLSMKEKKQMNDLHCISKPLVLLILGWPRKQGRGYARLEALGQNKIALYK